MGAITKLFRLLLLGLTLVACGADPGPPIYVYVQGGAAGQPQPQPDAPAGSAGSAGSAGLAASAGAAGAAGAGGGDAKPPVTDETPLPVCDGACPAGEGVRRPRPVMTTDAPLAPAQMSSSVMLIGDWDITPNPANKDPDGHALSRCEQMVDIAAGLGNDTVSFVPTHDFLAAALLEENGKQRVDKYNNPMWTAQDYCFKHGTNAQTGKDDCLRFDDAADQGDSVSRIRGQWAACFQRAFEYDMNVSLVPHLDDGAQQGVWRNSVAFDPTLKLGPSGKTAFSYEDVMLEPLAEALLMSARKAHARGRKIYFAMQGEMGATIFYAPKGYQDVADRLRTTLAPLKTELAVEIQIGVSVNYNTVTGGQAQNPSAALKSDLQTLFKSVDFVGVSSYGSVLARPIDEDLDSTLNSLSGELGAYDIDLAALAKAGTKLHFSEIGLGGGNGKGGLAETVDIAASRPYAGVGAYDSARNPWDPVTRPEFVKLQKRFYRAALDYLARPHDPNTLTGSYWYVDQAFIWNLGSWDVQAIYPDSTKADGSGSYYDDVIACMIFQHNTGSASCLVRPPIPWLSKP